MAIPNPESVEIGDDIDLDRISGENVTIYTGCKIWGRTTLICHNTRLGYEGPVSVENCQIGPSVDLRGGFFKKAVFLKQVRMGSGAQVREGSVLEEQAGGAHTVALKQTILFPFVTLGSLINFCDCLMAGGTSRRNHSEVGSSYVHFNFTPSQDKATPSLLGDVPRGVMLDQPPIFLGGQGGLVGPCRIGFGNVIAAGTIFRKDEPGSGMLLTAGQPRGARLPFKTGTYPNIKRIVFNNIDYIANLVALFQWSLHVRSQFVSKNFPTALLSGLQDKLTLGIDERLRRLMDLSRRMPGKTVDSKHPSDAGDPVSGMSRHEELAERGQSLVALLDRLRGFTGDESIREPFLTQILHARGMAGDDYLKTIQSLKPPVKAQGTAWLQGIVDHVHQAASGCLPGFYSSRKGLI